MTPRSLSLTSPLSHAWLLALLPPSPPSLFPTVDSLASNFDWAFLYAAVASPGLADDLKGAGWDLDRCMVGRRGSLGRTGVGLRGFLLLELLELKVDMAVRGD